MEDLIARISVDPAICHGRACIQGTRIPIAVILDCLADGMNNADILKEYPTLAEHDIRAAIDYAARLAREEIRPLAPAG